MKDDIALLANLVVEKRIGGSGNSSWRWLHGWTMFNDRSNPLEYFRSRRSCRPRDMIAPGPDAAAIDDIIRIAMRTPDHGKLSPWRFIKVADDARGDLAILLERAVRAENPDIRPAQIDAAVGLAHMAPALVILIYSPQPSAKIPEWEQQLSAGAVGMNLLHGAHAHGFVGGWVTGWPAYNDIVRAHLCAGEQEDNEQIAGFFFMGTAQQELTERPRPDQDIKVTDFPSLPS